MVVVAILGVVNEVLPEESAVPPEAAAYQSIVSPVPGVAVKVTVPVPHLDTLAVADGRAGNGFSVIVMEAVAVQPLLSIAVTE